MAKFGRLTPIRFLVFGVLLLAVTFVGSDALADCRTDCQGLWPGFVRAS